jgi:hypothetical protein
MEPNKFENEIRNQLNQRSIQPSEQSWDRLDAMLTIAEQTKKRSFKWLYIAASFVGFTLIGFFLFNQQKNEGLIVPENNVVIEEKQSSESNEVPIVLKNAPNLQPNQNKAVASQVFDEKKSKNSMNIDPKKDKVLDVALTNIAVKEVETSTQPTMPIKINPEILLANVEKGELLTTNTEVSSKSVKVDANSLLTSVEKEVDASFRDKAIQTLNKNYKSVKSMLANRNSQ